MLMFCAAYLIIFGAFAGLVGQGSLGFSTSDFIALVLVSGGITIGVTAAAAGLAGLGVVGSGSPEAGRYVWRAGLFALIAIWTGFFVYAIADLMPAETPVAVSTLLLGPPVVGIIWGMFKVWHGTGG